MRLLLDTHIFLVLLDQRVAGLPDRVKQLLSDSGHAHLLSAASLWEIAIKWRLGKLRLAVDLGALPGLLDSIGIRVLPVDRLHALAAVEPEPLTRDPFDRMLLAQCQIERLRLVTIDRALTSHPLAATGPVPPG
jgi:PIN domain nuclease of toxin-antitoxin system